MAAAAESERRRGRGRGRGAGAGLQALPEEVLAQVLASGVPCAQLASLRPLCRALDRACGDALTRAFKREVLRAAQRRPPPPQPPLPAPPPRLPALWAAYARRLLDNVVLLLDVAMADALAAGRLCFFAGRLLDEVRAVGREAAAAAAAGAVALAEVEAGSERLREVHWLALAALRHFVLLEERPRRRLAVAPARFARFHWSFMGSLRARPGAAAGPLGAQERLAAALRLYVREGQALARAARAEAGAGAEGGARPRLVRLQEQHLLLHACALRCLRRRHPELPRSPPGRPAVWPSCAQ